MSGAGPKHVKATFITSHVVMVTFTSFDGYRTGAGVCRKVELACLSAELTMWTRFSFCERCGQPEVKPKHVKATFITSHDRNSASTQSQAPHPHRAPQQYTAATTNEINHAALPTRGIGTVTSFDVAGDASVALPGSHRRRTSMECAA